MDIFDQLLHKMETLDEMDYELFDLNGKNYCPVDGTISLKKFVDDDNNLKFYSLVRKVRLIEKIIKNDGHKAFIEFEIFFQKPGSDEKGPSVVCDWVIEAPNGQKITSIDSFWDVSKFKEELTINYPDYLKFFFKKSQ